nr:PREDICTED: macrophage mannose receptor 1-like [Latimeria chalumnae]|eukprot:XP_014354215.1 PREDICTED: macrophage mannose receptor 1-like [Latimeria chalumnae]
MGKKNQEVLLVAPSPPTSDAPIVGNPSYASDFAKAKVRFTMKSGADVIVLLLLTVTSTIAVDMIKEYILVKENLTWPRAQNYCRTHHKDLVSIHSKEEVKTLLEKYRDVNVDFLWIGLEKNASKDQWMWSSGEPVNFTNWGENEPNNKGQREDYVVMQYTGKWHDYACTSSQFYVCFNDPKCNQPQISTSQNNRVQFSLSFTSVSCSAPCSGCLSLSRFHIWRLSGSRSSGDLKYHLIQEKKTWFEARDTCRKNYTDLVSITSQQELWNITNITEGKNVWIGLYQNPWQWSNGDESSFQYWDTNDPSIEADEACVGVWLKHKGDGHPSEVGKWADFRSNTYHQYFLCYKEKFILIKENKTWTDALLYCRHKYGDLVSVTDCDVQKEVAEIAKESDGDRVWIGLRKDSLFGFWFWMEGNESDYEYWGNGVQTDPQMDHCGSIDKSKNSTWGIQCCLTELNFICSI